MKILANRKIKALFYKIMVCMLIFIVVSVSFMMFELNNAALYILLCALFMCIAIMAACYGYFKEQNEIMENAVAQITEYISGNRETRIECDEEVVLCQEKVQVKSELFLQPSIFYPANLSILFNFCSYTFSYSFGDRYPQ